MTEPSLVAWMQAQCDQERQQTRVHQQYGQDVGRSDSIKLVFIQTSNPRQKAHIERFNRTMGYELLSPHLFANIGEEQER